MANESSSLRAHLSKADQQIRLYVKELKNENARLQSQLAKHEVQQVSRENRIKALEKEMKAIKKTTGLTITTVFAGFDPKLPPTQLEKLFLEKAVEFGYRVEKNIPGTLDNSTSQDSRNSK